jgi:hypothetical protein
MNDALAVWWIVDITGYGAQMSEHTYLLSSLEVELVDFPRRCYCVPLP